VVSIAGLDPRNDNEFFFMIEPTTGGWGASQERDGESSLINNVNGSFKDIPVEVFENKYPLRLLSYGIREDSGGIGKHRGGNGTYREYLVQADSDLFLWFERSETTAWGIFDGQDGLAPNVFVQRPGEDTLEVLKINGIKVQSGTVIKSLTGGGGGYGKALSRDPAAVREDVIDGYVTLEHAREAYGVVINESLEVDDAATAKLRSV